MYQAQEIVKGKFWIVTSSYGKVGTLRLVDNKYELFDQRDNSKKVFESFNEAFKEKQTSRESDVTGTLINIDGFNTGQTVAFPVDHEDLPLFKKTKNGQAVYAAGYYIVEFSGMGWQYAFAPKYSTLCKYNYRGPFVTEWEMNLQLRKHRRNKHENNNY